MRASTRGELLANVREDKDEISVPVMAFECGVRLLLAPFVRSFLGELPVHPLQVSPAL